MVNDLIRVFFHELGHFVARVLNHQHFNATKVKSIGLDLANADLLLYTGELKVDLPEDESKNLIPTLKTLPEYLASSTYGCIFQSYWLKKELNDCFNVNGMDDYCMWLKSLGANKLEDFKSEFTEVEKNYFAYLRDHNLLDMFMDINAHDFIYKNSPEYSNYHVDIQKLKNAIMPLIQKHFETYLLIIDKYKDIIHKHTTKPNKDKLKH